jgi:hypothetical protein
MLSSVAVKPKQRLNKQLTALGYQHKYGITVGAQQEVGVNIDRLS